jgi:hypothetical protein
MYTDHYIICVFRFGEESLHNCEVMLYDLDCSRRMNTQVTRELKTVWEANPQCEVGENGITVVICPYVYYNYLLIIYFTFVFVYRSEIKQ